MLSIQSDSHCLVGGGAFSRWRPPHIVVDAISHAYEASEHTSPFGVGCHSSQEHPHVGGCPEGYTPGLYLCRCLMGITGKFSRFHWVNVAESSGSTLGSVIRIPRDFVGISHSVL